MQHKIILSIFLSACFFCASAIAESAPKNINQVMTEIGKTMVDTFPLIVAKRQLTSDEEKQLKLSVSKLLDLFAKAKPFIDEKSSTYQISYDLVLDHLRKTQRSFNTRSIELARKRLYSLGNICASCHTQDSQLRTLFPGISRQHFTSDYAFAEFSYITRDYNKAVKYFDKYLRNQKVRKTELDIITPMQRLITIYTQIFNTPDVAAQQLSEYRKLKDHTKETKTHLEDWIIGLKDLHTSKVTQKERLNFTELKKYVAEFIGSDDQATAEFFSTPQKEVSRVWLRGQLYHYLNTNPPKDEIPMILYWLSLCDRSVGYDFYFSLADLYLKQCIVKHPSHPYAKRCYKEYEEFIEVSYSGSAGTFVPPDLEEELFELKQALQKAKSK